MYLHIKWSIFFTQQLAHVQFNLKSEQSFTHSFLFLGQVLARVQFDKQTKTGQPCLFYFLTTTARSKIGSSLASRQPRLLHYE